MEINKCLICNSLPKIKDLHDMDPVNEHQYKCFCSKDGNHLSNSNWYKTRDDAIEDWNKKMKKKEINNFEYIKSLNMKELSDFLLTIINVNKNNNFNVFDIMKWLEEKRRD